MLIYITKPVVQECIMGGLRSILLWTKEPHYHHLPTHIESINKKENKFIDLGWENGIRNIPTPAKPLLEQDEELAEKVWQKIVWSCCPKGVSFENHKEWCNTPFFVESKLKYDKCTNYENMIHHKKEGENADIISNINYKRFLLEVNIRTNEVKIIVPNIHWYKGSSLFIDFDSTEQTLEIPEQYAKESSYSL